MNRFFYRFTILSFILALSFHLVASPSVLASDSNGVIILPGDTGDTPSEKPGSTDVSTIPPVSPTLSDKELSNLPEISSKYASLIDIDTGTILFEKNGYEKANPASTTKIMTAILVLEKCPDLSIEVEAGAEVNEFSPANSLMGLIQYEKLTLRDLLYGLMLLSGNDSAATLAIHVGGSIENFAAMMNSKAKELGLTQTNFTNPHGLTDENHYTTAIDLAIISRYAMQNGDFKAVVSSPSHTLAATNKHSEPRTISNTNRLIKPDSPDYWSAANGIKTGSTSAAKGCLVSSASYNGMNMVAVALHDDSPSAQSRWSDTKKIIEYGFENVKYLDLQSIIPSLPPVTTLVEESSRYDEEKGKLLLSIKSSDIRIGGLSSQIDPIKENPAQLQVIPSIENGFLTAPVKGNTKVGTAEIRQGERVLAVVDLISSRDVNAHSDDPKNPVSSLIQTVYLPSGKLNIPMLIFLFLGIGILLLLIIFIISNSLNKRHKIAPKTKRNRYKHDFSA